jgi:N-acetylglutamate synthase-like GNAT family acetyltransferase
VKDIKIRKETEHFLISTAKELLDLDMIHEFLSTQSYWLKGIRKELVAEIINNSSVCYGIYEKTSDANNSFKQIGFARVITDFVRFSWLADVFVLPEYRGKGLSKWLLDIIVDHPKLKGTRFMLATADAHGLYSQYGFSALEKPEDIMMRKADMSLILEGYNLK